MTTVEMVILSHLSDAQMDILYNPELANKRIQFVRTLVFDYPNTTVTIDDDKLDEIWNSLSK